MAHYGTYIDLSALKSALNIASTDTSDDAELLTAAESASRECDDWCGRHFYTVTDTRQYSARNAAVLLLPDDLLSISELATDDGTYTYPDIWSASGYLLQPSNQYPKWKIIRRPNGRYWLPRQEEGVQIAGVFGYGDGESAHPWRASGAMVTVATTSGTTVTASSGAAFRVGQTIRAGDEQMYVTAINTDTLTVERAVNGTTATTHSTAVASIAVYPLPVVEATLRLAQRAWRLRDVPFGVQGGADMGTTIVQPRGDSDIWARLGAYRKVGVA